MIETTAVEATNGMYLLVELHEDTQTVRFTTEGGSMVAEYPFATFAGIRGALALNLGDVLTLDAETVAGLQQWADLDAFGLRRRERSA